MITLSTEGKTIDTGPAARLITEGEKNADVIRIEMPASYGTLDLTALTWVLAGVTDRETRVEQELVKDTSDGLTLQWTVTGDWAAVPGRMRLEDVYKRQGRPRTGGKRRIFREFFPLDRGAGRGRGLSRFGAGLHNGVDCLRGRGAERL